MKLDKMQPYPEGAFMPSGVRWIGNKWQIRYQINSIPYSEVLELPNTEAGMMQAICIRKNRIAEKKENKISYLVSAESLDEAFKSAFANARRREGYMLTRKDEFDLIAQSGGRCSVSGLYFTVEATGFHKAPFAPSLDRIDSKRGYEVGNCRLVCTCANYAMNEWGEDVLRQMALSYAAKHLMEQTYHPTIKLVGFSDSSLSA